MISMMQVAGGCSTTPSIASLPLTLRGGPISTFCHYARRDASFPARGRKKGISEGNKICVSVNSVYSTICASIGFTDDPRTSVVRKAHTLLLDASSLLVYQEVLKAPAAQHFLTILLLLSRSNFDETKLLSCYGEFYRSLVLSGSSSWEDFILDGILAGVNNPFAQSSKALSPSGEAYPSDGPQGCTDFDLRAAAASDLDCLQHLAIDDTTLSGWVSHFAEVRPAWLAAVRGGSSESSTRDKKRITASTPTAPSPFPQMGFGIIEARPLEHSEEGVAETLEFDDVCPGSGMVGLADPSNRKEWRRAVGDLSKWSGAVDALASSYLSHGTGPAAFHTDLVWAGGKLGKARSLNLVLPTEEWLEWTWVKSMVKEFFEDRSGNAIACNILLDPSFEAKESDVGGVRGVNLRTAAAESRAAGLRTVSVGRGEVKNMAALARVLEQQPGVRFCVLVEDLQVKKGEEAFSALSDTMTGVSQPFPANVIVCASTTQLSAGFSSLFQKKFASCNKVHQQLEEGDV